APRRISGRQASAPTRPAKPVTRPIPACPATCSPQVARNAAPPRRIASRTPMPSITTSGSTRKVTSVQAVPARPVTSRPTSPLRSWIERSTIETVALTSAHGRICPARDAAPAIAEPSVGSPPASRSLAAWISAAWKKIVTYAPTRYPTAAGTHPATPGANVGSDAEAPATPSTSEPARNGATHSTAATPDTTGSSSSSLSSRSTRHDEPASAHDRRSRSIPQVCREVGRIAPPSAERRLPCPRRALLPVNFSYYHVVNHERRHPHHHPGARLVRGRAGRHRRRAGLRALDPCPGA